MQLSHHDWCEQKEIDKEVAFSRAACARERASRLAAISAELLAESKLCLLHTERAKSRSRGASGTLEA